MLRLFSEEPKRLLDGHIVHVSEGFEHGDTGEYAGKYFEIRNPQQISFDRWYIIPTGDHRDVDLTNGTGAFQESIYPDHTTELHEVLFAFEGRNTGVYPMIPSGRYFQRLPYSSMYPDPTNAIRRHLGAWKETDTHLNQEDPSKTSMNVRLTLFKNGTPLVLRTRVDSDDTFEKVVFHFVINRCSLLKIPHPTEREKQVARTILHETELKKGTT